MDIPDEEFWRSACCNKQHCFAYLQEYTRRRWASGELDPKQVVAAGPFLQPEPLTIGFARRFATYKRATLLFSDPDRLARILTEPDRPGAAIFAGKAHPADDGGKRLIQEIFWRSLDPRFEGRIAFAEDYDMLLAARLDAGVDVWLNNPRAPLEASGTSGMKAAANGALNLSVLDGWWIEGWNANHETGWGIEPRSSWMAAATPPMPMPSTPPWRSRLCRCITSETQQSADASGFADRKRRSARSHPDSRRSGW